jgi:poly-D-alanine transfer protein DltD
MDSYNLKNDWEECQKMTNELEENIKFFVKNPISRKWCSFVRKKSKDIEKLNKKIKKNIIRQRQDYQSDYS